MKIALVDDHKLYTEALSQLFKTNEDHKLKLLWIAHDAFSAMKAIEKSIPDILLLDLNLPGQDGLSLLPELLKMAPDLKVIIVSMYQLPNFIKSAFVQGAYGYVLKSSGWTELSRAITEVSKGNSYLNEGLKIFPKKDHKNGSVQTSGLFEDPYLKKKNLTRREVEILVMISRAMNNKQIANELYISDQTVSVHRKNIMRKIGASNTAGLIKFALDNSII